MTTVEPIRNKKDIEKVEKYLLKQSKRDRLLFVLGINCGLRISDILALNVGDVRNKRKRNNWNIQTDSKTILFPAKRVRTA